MRAGETTAKTPESDCALPLRGLLDALDAAVVAFSPDGTLVYANPAFGELSGHEPDSLEGTSAPFPFWPAELRPRYTRLHRALAVDGRGDGDAAPFTLQQASGRELPVRVTRIVERAPQGCVHVALVRPERPLSPERAVARLRSVERGLQRIADEVSRVRLRPPEAAPCAPSGEWRSLSAREREVLRALLEGRETAEIAGHLCISRHTVRNHLKAIFRKLDVHSQRELMTRFHASGGANAANPR